MHTREYLIVSTVLKTMPDHAFALPEAHFTPRLRSSEPLATCFVPMLDGRCTIPEITRCLQRESFPLRDAGPGTHRSRTPIPHDKSAAVLALACALLGHTGVRIVSDCGNH